MAIRLSLGAGRGRLILQLLIESLLLAMAGAAAGILVADWFTKWSMSSAPSLKAGAMSPGMHMPQ